MSLGAEWIGDLDGDFFSAEIDIPILDTDPYRIYRADLDDELSLTITSASHQGGVLAIAGQVEGVLTSVDRIALRNPDPDDTLSVSLTFEAACELVRTAVFLIAICLSAPVLADQPDGDMTGFRSGPFCGSTPSGQNSISRAKVSLALRFCEPQEVPSDRFHPVDGMVADGTQASRTAARGRRRKSRLTVKRGRGRHARDRPQQ